VKFSKSSLTLLVLGVVVIGAIMTNMLRAQQVQQQQELKQQLIAAQQKLVLMNIDDLTLKKDQLTRDKELYASRIADAKAKLAAPFDDISATDILLKSAHEYDLLIVSIKSSGASDDTLAKNKFTVLPLTLQVEGSTVNIAGFISNLKTLFPTSLVETYQITITPPEPTPTAIDTAATININIYDYKGDTYVE
jgi:hypothetical protein